MNDDRGEQTGGVSSRRSFRERTVSHTKVLQRAAAVEWSSNQTLWALVLGAAMADLGTTAVGLHRGFVESNPIGVFTLDVAGFAGLIVLKVTVIIAAILFCEVLRSLPESVTSDSVPAVVPVSLSVVWLLAAGWNLTVLIGGDTMIREIQHALPMFPLGLVGLSLGITVAVFGLYEVTENAAETAVVR